MKKRIICFAFILILVFNILPLSFADTTWSFDDKSGTLTISGTGDMVEYEDDRMYPWYSIRQDIKSIIINNSITSISRSAFFYCTSLTDVKIPDSVTKIGVNAFAACYSLESVTIPDSVTSIGAGAFRECENLRCIALPNSISKISEYTFILSGVRVIYIPKSVKAIENNAFYNSEIAHVYYQGSEKDRQSITLAENRFLNDAKWVYNADGLPDHVDTLCEQKTIINSSRVFVDVKESAWYKKYVDYVYSYGIFKGNLYREFLPDDNINRAEFVQVLANLSGVDTSVRDVKTKFTDIAVLHWCAPAVKWASENGIVSGFGNGLFKPFDSITREQMCVMLLNYAKFKSIELKPVEDKAAFADDSKISKWAKTAVYTCQAADIVNGKGKNTFDPQGTGTRAEACVIFTKFHKDYLAK